MQQHLAAVAMFSGGVQVTERRNEKAVQVGAAIDRLEDNSSRWLDGEDCSFISIHRIEIRLLGLLTSQGPMGSSALQTSRSLCRSLEGEDSLEPFIWASTCEKMPSSGIASNPPTKGSNGDNDNVATMRVWTGWQSGTRLQFGSWLCFRLEHRCAGWRSEKLV
jgi:hypothetical protein